MRGCRRACFPIIYGVPAEISEYLLASPIVRKVSFTGSIPVGKQLMKLAAEGMKRTTMELGGHAPVLVFDDVDVEKVVDACADGEISQCGPGVRLAHALLRARENLQSVRRGLCGARESSAGG